jgi:hypothetical protein
MRRSRAHATGDDRLALAQVYSAAIALADLR